MPIYDPETLVAYAKHLEGEIERLRDENAGMRAYISAHSKVCLGEARTVNEQTPIRNASAEELNKAFGEATRAAAEQSAPDDEMPRDGDDYEDRVQWKAHR